MRVSMLYNKNAGDPVRLDYLCDVIAHHGHELVSVIEKPTEVDRLLDGLPEVVVAAGGDGTIGLAARMLAHKGIPLAILPLGTANNVARSVGTPDSIDDAIGGWETARRVPLDLGVADGVWGRRRFVEGVGGGLISTAITDMQKRSDGDELPARSKVAGALRAISDVLSRLKPVEWTIVADGARTTGKFLLVEILNIGSIGPNLLLAPDANPSDGLFNLVMAGEEHREALSRYLQDLVDGDGHPPSVTSQRARHVTVQGATEVHVDDQILSAGSKGVSMHVEAGALELLR
jgi:diacylglycerol kinase family enzyme